MQVRLFVCLFATIACISGAASANSDRCAGLISSNEIAKTESGIKEAAGELEGLFGSILDGEIGLEGFYRKYEKTKAVQFSSDAQVNIFKLAVHGICLSSENSGSDIIELYKLAVIGPPTEDNKESYGEIIKKNDNKNNWGDLTNGIFEFEKLVDGAEKSKFTYKFSTSKECQFIIERGNKTKGVVGFSLVRSTGTVVGTGNTNGTSSFEILSGDYEFSFRLDPRSMKRYHFIAKTNC